MGLLRFLFSKTFLHQILLTIPVGIAIVYGTLYLLKISTHHNEFVVVPNLNRLSLEEVSQVLEKASLRFEVIDSAHYNPSYNPFSVIEQTPVAGDQVKEDRKIYLTVNPSNYRKVTIPNIIQITQRSAISTLKAVGLEVGEITYRDNIGKDMVLQLRYNNKPVVPGTMVPKMTPIDLVLGNGNRTP
jgi:beta-lactam-binding protein with PASTA domain